MNPSFVLQEVSADETQAELVIEPLEQGFGHTVGNALRRVLLSSLPGAAITSVRIDGVEHQFSTLEGLREDVVNLILNLKKVRLKAAGSENKATLSLSVNKPGKVTAAQIEVSDGFEVVNKDQYLATLSKGKKLTAELEAQVGVGYSMARERQEEAMVGEIPIDALFSPVIKVSYKVEATRVGRRTDFDKVILQVMTDGTISPLEVTQLAARILARQFTQVFEPVVQEQEVEETKLSPEEAETLRLTVEELDLPTRIANALRKGGFKTVGDLVGAPKMIVAKVKNLGEKSVDVIDEALQKKGVQLGD